MFVWFNEVNRKFAFALILFYYNQRRLLDGPPLGGIITKSLLIFCASLNLDLIEAAFTMKFFLV